MSSSTAIPTSSGVGIDRDDTDLARATMRQDGAGRCGAVLGAAATGGTRLPWDASSSVVLAHCTRDESFQVCQLTLQ
jgi:hypothetical protein